MGLTANIIIKEVIRIFASISKIMRILLMGRRNREHCIVLLHNTVRCQHKLNQSKISWDIHNKHPIVYAEMEMSPFWWNFHHWLHWKLSKWQLPVQPAMKISWKWQHFHFSVPVRMSLLHLNSFWPSDGIWQHKSRSTLVQAMACCLTAPNHNLNQCWLIISQVLWHLPEDNFTGNAQYIHPWFEFENY